MKPSTASYPMEAWKNRDTRAWRQKSGNMKDPIRFEMRVDGDTHTIDHETQGELELSSWEARQLMESLMHFFNKEIV